MPPAATLALWFSMITTKSLVGFPTGLFVPVDSVGGLVGEDDPRSVGLLDEGPEAGLLLPLEQPAANSSAARPSVTALTDVLTKVPHRSSRRNCPVLAMVGMSSQSAWPSKVRRRLEIGGPADPALASAATAEAVPEAEPGEYERCHDTRGLPVGALRNPTDQRSSNCGPGRGGFGQLSLMSTTSVRVGSRRASRLAFSITSFAERPSRCNVAISLP
jgi:hypothetical protein